MKIPLILLATALAGSIAPAIHAAEATNKPASKLDALFEDKVIAKGKGFEVRQSEVDEAFSEMRAAAASRGQTIPEAQRSAFEYKMLEKAIVAKILTLKATEDDKAKALERSKKLIEDTMKNFPTPEAFERQLKVNGLNFGKFEQKTVEQVTWQLVLENALRPKVSVTDDQVKAFYTNNPARFEKPEQVRASHVLISTLDSKQTPPAPLPEDKKKEKLELAKKIQERAQKGEDFAALAKEYSDDPGSKEKGGEYTFPRGKMVKPFEVAAFSLQTNQVSDVVETQFGYHIIKLSEKIPAEVVPFDKVAKELKDAMFQQEIQKLIPDYVEVLKKENDVEISIPMPELLKNQPKP
jgi:peptidyl-prolyl cis-trans isomerase C